MFISKTSRRRSNRRGSVKILVLVLMVPLLCFAALGLDIGWITMTRSQLQNAADSSAIAGATKLAELFADHAHASKSQQMRLVAKSQAMAINWSTEFAGLNSAGEVDSLGLNKDDIEVGFLDGQGLFRQDSSEYPNTVRVRVRRDTLANSPLRLFFAPVMGQKSTSLNAFSSASIYSGLIESFDPNYSSSKGRKKNKDGYDCLLLPVALDANLWQSFVSGQESENVIKGEGEFASNSLIIYPSPKTTPGNVGLLCIGPSTNQNKTFSEWILNGPSPDDIRHLISTDRFPVSQESPKIWQASPGLRSSLGKDFKSIIGQPRLLPLFEPVSESPYQAAFESGSDASYKIVGFAGVLISSVKENGGRLVITVHPHEVFDSTAIYDWNSLCPAGAEPTGRLKTFTYLMPRLNQ